MNYRIESSFLTEENLDIVIWAEKMLHKFLRSGDHRLGLNICTAEEKEIIRLMSRCFFLDYNEQNEKCFLSKNEDSRSPFLTLKNYLTKSKLNKHFKQQKEHFYDNLDELNLGSEFDFD